MKNWEAVWNRPEFCGRIAALYGEDQVAVQKARYEALIEKYESAFGAADGAVFFSAPGRTEIGGNHTDHNHGLCLAAAVDLDTVALAEKTEDGTITVDSEGFPPITVSISDLEPREGDYGHTRGLIRGMAGALQRRGYRIGGFRAKVISSVARGSGLSSSAAFEVLLCAILDGLYNGFSISPKERAIISQEVENVWFGKPCGLLDQMASSVGGLVQMDFADADPKVEGMQFDFARAGYALCVVNTGGNHGDLTDDYAAIRTEMESVARVFGKSCLREVPREDMEAQLSKVRKACGERAVLRAWHFYDDNERVVQECKALRDGDIQTFFDTVTRSGDSSWKLLQNVYARPKEEQMAFAIEATRRFLKGAGAQRVHGGGFAGTIQAYVPLDLVPEYIRMMEALFEPGCAIPLRIRPEGAVMMPAGDLA